ncbi:MAG: hypothetical protein JST40_11550 [Armatimonadetes bacterium]|nr:hypothetical protein [Armatimonadota bacterium]
MKRPDPLKLTLWIILSLVVLAIPLHQVGYFDIVGIHYAVAEDITTFYRLNRRWPRDLAEFKNSMRTHPRMYKVAPYSPQEVEFKNIRALDQSRCEVTYTLPTMLLIKRTRVDVIVLDPIIRTQATGSR